MYDLEKVIKGLECCEEFNKLSCDKCPYDYNGRGDGKSECTAELATDALALLTEQERIIKLYEKAEPFLHSHGWDWTQVDGVNRDE